MKHLPWNAYLAMSGKQSRRLDPATQALLNSALASQCRARQDPNSDYWQAQVANCRTDLSAAFPEHMAALDAALPSLFEPTDTYRELALRLAPIVRRVYAQYQTAADLVAAFDVIHHKE
jgi:hypothetical protein